MKKITLITALINIAKNPSNELQPSHRSATMANVMGDSLEEYIKNAFAGTFKDSNDKITIHEKIFSWLGNQNNPPDLILKHYDAIEVKKIEGTGGIALNSSYPKDKLISNSSMITNNCRACEGNSPWEKDILYAIGTVKNKKIKYLFFVYGGLYAADKQHYEKIRSVVKAGVESSNLDFTETNELGKVKKVDPLGITELRIRGMWSIAHPFTVFNYVPQIKKDESSNYTIYAIIPEKKYLSYDESVLKELFQNPNANMHEILLKNPNNPAKLLKAFLIKLIF